MSLKKKQQKHVNNKHTHRQAQWHMSAIPVLGRLKQGDYWKFEYCKLSCKLNKLSIQFTSRLSGSSDHIWVSYPLVFSLLPRQIIELHLYILKNHYEYASVTFVTTGTKTKQKPEAYNLKEGKFILLSSQKCPSLCGQQAPDRSCMEALHGRQEANSIIGGAVK